MSSISAKTIPKSNFKQSAIIQVERAIGDIRCGAWVVLKDNTSATLCAHPEALGVDELQTWTAQKNAGAALVIPPARARRIGLKITQKTPVRVLLEALHGADDILNIIDPLRGGNVNLDALMLGAADVTDEAAIQLAKQAFLLPCMVIQPLPVKHEHADKWAFENNVVSVNTADILSYGENIASSVEVVSEANVPLQGAENARVIAFRPRIGNAEHLAVVIGDISKSASPLVRVHSSCITGDILGSLRCDCGEQLHASIAAMGKEGAGVLLYLNQEGRGIGIANKLRAYALQDSGLDTVDANIEMGFDADERTFLVAAKMLEKLGVKSIRLMTNNPQKTSDLSRYGIAITQRVPLAIEANAHNSAYLDTKAKRCGHIL